MNDNSPAGVSDERGVFSRRTVLSSIWVLASAVLSTFAAHGPSRRDIIIVDGWIITDADRH